MLGCFANQWDFASPQQLEREKMKKTRRFTALIEREGNGFVALCPELDIASEGRTLDEARNNLAEALELFFESASPEEVTFRLLDEFYITHLEIAVG